MIKSFRMVNRTPPKTGLRHKEMFPVGKKGNNWSRLVGFLNINLGKSPCWGFRLVYEARSSKNSLVMSVCVATLQALVMRCGCISVPHPCLLGKPSKKYSHKIKSRHFSLEAKMPYLDFVFY